MKQPSLIAAHAAATQTRLDVFAKYPGAMDADISTSLDARAGKGAGKWYIDIRLHTQSNSISGEYSGPDFWQVLNQARAALELDQMEPTV